MEVNKSSVKFKMFSDVMVAHIEDAKEKKAALVAMAQNFKQEMLEKHGQLWSDIADSPKGGVFVAYCRAGELAALSVKESGYYFGMRDVELSAGYIVGRNWRDCH